MAEEQTEELSKWMTPLEVAEGLDVDRATVQRWIRAGKLAAVKTPGDQYRILRSDFDEMATPRPAAS